MKQVIMGAGVVWLLVAGTGLTGAQEEVFNIRDYQVPEYSRRSLELTPDLSLNSTTGKDETHYIKRDTSINITSIPLNAAVRLGASYQQMTNTKKYQGEHSLRLVPQVSLDYQENGDYRVTQATTRNVIGLVPTLATANRLFLRNEIFTELTAGVGGSYFLRSYGNETIVKDSTTAESNMWRSHLNLTPSIALYYGLGRIDEVQDARLALYILDELKARGRLVKYATSQVIQEFAELLTRINQERYLDYREWDIRAITQIDSFLTAQGLADVMDAVYFARVKDMWEYGRTPVRKSGQQLKGGPVGSISWTADDYGSRLNHQSLGVKLRFESEYPVDRKTQLSVWGEAAACWEGVNTFSNTQPDLRVKAKAVNRADLELGGQLGYYPSTRTEVLVSAGIDGNIGNSKISVYQKPQNEGEGSFNQMDIEAGLKVHYYVSPQMFVSGSLDIKYNWLFDKENYEMDYIPNYNTQYFDNRHKESGFSNRFGVYLTYKVF